MRIGQQGEKVAASYFQCGNGINCKDSVVLRTRIGENSATYKKYSMARRDGVKINGYLCSNE